MLILLAFLMASVLVGSKVSAQVSCVNCDTSLVYLYLNSDPARR